MHPLEVRTDSDLLVIELSVTDVVAEAARLRSGDIKDLNRSFSTGEYVLGSLICEEVVARYLGVRIDSTFDFDLKLKDGRKADVKSSTTHIKPDHTFDARVPAKNVRQKTDIYIFTRILKDHSTVWICGWLSKYDYLMNAWFFERGETCPFNRRITYQGSTFVLPVGDLNPIETLYN